MTLKKLVEDYLNEAKMMQLATVSGDQPWSCTLYYVADESLNLYWISMENTRHSKEIGQHEKVSASIPIKFKDLVVVGVQAEGVAELVKNTEEIKRIMSLYTNKFNRGKDWYKNFIDGKNDHKLYRMKPRSFVIYDRENFPDNPRRELELA
ncbi:MAG: pyridoxamine 5'-phosphate oxidase family protein [Candidatus Woykebacteria bacterium]